MLSETKNTKNTAKPKPHKANERAIKYFRMMKKKEKSLIFYGISVETRDFLSVRVWFGNQENLNWT